MSNRIASALRQIGPKFLLRSAVLVAVLAAIAWFGEHTSFEDLVDRLRPGENDSPWPSAVLFTVLGGLFTAAGGPRQAVGFFGAWLFGLAPGFGLGLAAAGLGCIAGHGLARLYADWARRIIRGRVDVAVQFWAKNPFTLTLILRLLPVGSNVLVNLASGAARIPAISFFAGSLVGYVPQTLIFALLGAGVNVGSTVQIALSAALFVVSAVIGSWVYARYRKQLKRERAKDGATTAMPS
jgi:uncharacterized membrane protein YdjX (TVP38/TMEM64 family)